MQPQGQLGGRLTGLPVRFGDPRRYPSVAMSRILPVARHVAHGDCD
jgi:hypothetical protein